MSRQLKPMESHHRRRFKCCVPRTGLQVVTVAFLLLASLTTRADLSVSFADEAICPVDVIWLPPAVLPYVGRDPTSLQVEFESDQIDMPEPHVLILTGGASVTQGAQSIYAENIVFDKNLFTLETGEAVVQTHEGDRLVVDSLELQLETRIGRADNVQFQIARRGVIAKGKVVDPDGVTHDTSGFTYAVAGRIGSVKGPRSYTPPDVITLPSGEVISVGKEDWTSAQTDTGSDAQERVQVTARSRGRADSLYFEGHDRERLENVVYSSCVAGDDTVLMEASEIILDHATGIGIGKHLKVRFFGVPILYFPTVSFPLTDERKTGFLFPTLGYGQDWGFNFRLPFYWNIAPDQDATFEWRVMANRGVQTAGEYRYLGTTAGGDYSGVLRAEYLPEDRKYGSSRYGWSYDHHLNTQRWDTDFILDVDLGYVSDPSYLDDLADNLQVSSASHIPQTVNLEVDPYDIFVEEENLRANLDLSAYQSVDAELTDDEEPYARLPGLKVTWDKTYDLSAEDRSDNYLRDDSTHFSLRPEVDSELVNFYHGSNDKTEGLRLDIQPAVSLRMERQYGAITPKLTHAYTAYSVSGQPIGKPSSPTRSIFLFEVASELFLERDINWGGVDYVQTLVPRLAYHYVPYKDQSNLPVFDSGSVGFNNIADAYLSDGFWGADRIQNFQGFTLGLESDTYASESGDRMMKWTLAQQVYLADREVTLNTGDASATSSYSPLLGELDFNITQQWNASGFASWNWDDSEIEEWRVGSAYTPGSRKQVNFNYQSGGDDNRNVEVGLNWPLAPRWQLGVSGLFGESEDDGQYTRVSLGYDACCWAIRVELEDRPIVEDDDSEESGGSRIMFTLRLKGLGTISSGEVLGLSRGFSTSALAL